jgi:hypothetical protein
MEFSSVDEKRSEKKGSEKKCKTRYTGWVIRTIRKNTAV